MRAIIQRVSRASVSVEDKQVSKIGKGLQVLVGIQSGDETADQDYMVQKILNLRLFNDEGGKAWARSVVDIDGEVLCVSQFTLYASTKQGKKPDFHMAMKSEESKKFYQDFLEKMRTAYKAEKVQDGVFGAMMDVDIHNDGPVTIILDSDGRKAHKETKNLAKEERKAKFAATPPAET